MNDVALAQPQLTFAPLPGIQPKNESVQSGGGVCLCCGANFPPKKCNSGLAKKFCSKECAGKYRYVAGGDGLKAKNRAYYYANKEKYLAWQRAYYKTDKGKESLRKRQQKHYPKKLAQAKNRVLNLRLSIYDMLGGRACSRCGYDNIIALTIEHVFGGGSKHRKSCKSQIPYLTGIKKEIEAGSNKYSVLCMNCQFISRYELAKQNPAPVSRSGE